MAPALDDIALLFQRRGAEQYSGEAVSQLEHALQAAHLAEQSSADDELVTAALLHDLGHLLGDHGDTPTLRGIDDRHEYAAVPLLRSLFGPRLVGAVARHVDAKRWLCAVRPGYHAGLSADSQRSLVLQGGVFAPAAAQAFIAQPHAKEAVQLRLWDDLAKQPGLATPPLAHYLARARRCLRAA
ncbi:phosphonate degradation HD-domain oxygenase [Aquincola sp. MAHUQ-54]|uniref:Phosphonate degradation HD-domain oxygenase n=1 Tax=Aquincola agrisoli TaxID=3119538 RepID=A0AAW9QKC0_9BURK